MLKRLAFAFAVLSPLVAFAQQPSEAALAREQLLRDGAAEQQAHDRGIVDQHWLVIATTAEETQRRLGEVCGRVTDEALKKLCNQPLALNKRPPPTHEEMCASVDAKTRESWALCNDQQPPPNAPNPGRQPEQR